MFSYWEQQSFLSYDHIVVGAGIVGLSVATELAEKYPDHSILVLERGILPSGASTRNAGFACMGSASELLDDLQHLTEDEVIALYEKRKKGLDILRGRLGDDPIGYRQNGSYELINKDEEFVLEKLEYLNALLKPITIQAAFAPCSEKIGAFGFSGEYTKALIENTCEGELHTGRMMRALTQYALSRSVEIKTGIHVSGFEETDPDVLVHVDDVVRGGNIRLRCRTLSICTNAFTRALLPDEDVTPGRGQVIITHPIPDLPFKGIYHFDKGYYYFREIEGRVLFGGGRNLDFQGETTTEFGENPVIIQDLKTKLQEVILPRTRFEIAYSWSGIMAFGQDKIPIVKSISDRVFGAFRMGGMGVALGSKAAKELVEKINV